MIFKKDKTLGYMYCYNPTHPCANKSGKVIEHVYVYWKHTGKLPNSGECIHHIDRDRSNNDINNLQLMTLHDHAKLHAIEDNGAVHVSYTCAHCEKLIETTEKNMKLYCSRDCSAEGNKKFDISKDELEKLVWEKSTTNIAKYYGVSDKAIEKRCKKYGITKPPRGYWAKKYNNKD